MLLHTSPATANEWLRAKCEWVDGSGQKRRNSFDAALLTARKDWLSFRPNVRARWSGRPRPLGAARSGPTQEAVGKFPATRFEVRPGLVHRNVF